MLRECEHCGSWYDTMQPGRTANYGDLVLSQPRLLMCPRTGKETNVTRTQEKLILILMRGFLGIEAVNANLFPDCSADTLKVHIHHIRKIIKALGSATVIKSIHGSGYSVEYLEQGNEKGTVSLDGHRHITVRLRPERKWGRPGRKRGDSLGSALSGGHDAQR